MYRFLFLCLFLAATLSPLTVAAQDEPEVEGLELNEEGLDAFEAGRFEEAAQTFARAYDLVGDPGIRKNEAIAWFKADRCEEAIAAANKFLLLENVPDDDAGDVRRIIANCKVAFAREAVEANSLDMARGLLIEAEGLEPDQHVIDQIQLVRIEIAKREAELREDTGAEEEPLPPQPEIVDAESGPDTSILEYVLMGVGGGLVLAGATYHAIAYGWQAEAQRMSREGGDPQRFDSLKRRVGTARILVPIVYGLGIASAATGLFLYSYTEPSETGERRVRLGVGYATTF